MFNMSMKATMLFALTVSNIAALVFLLLMMFFPWMIPFIVVQFIGFVLLSIGVANDLLQPEA